MRTARLVVTVDASFDPQRRVVGIGVFVHGSPSTTRTMKLAEAWWGIPPREMEKYAVFRALETASELGFARVKVRSDYNQMRRRLKDDYRGGVYGARGLHGMVLTLARSFEETTFAYVPRRKNHVAHNLARRGAKDLDPATRWDIFDEEDLAPDFDAAFLGGCALPDFGQPLEESAR